MAQLFPENFNLATLPYSEQRAVSALLQDLDDTWIVLPNIPITLDGADREIDCVLVSFDHGVFIAETKGGVMKITEGVWHSNEHEIKDPSVQVVAAKHALIRRLNKMRVDLNSVFIQHIVLLPDIIDFPEEGAGPGCPREIVFTKTDLENPEQKLSTLRRENEPISAEHIKKLLTALRPDVTEIQLSGKYFTGVSHRLNRTTQNTLSSLLPLDVNRNLYTYGAAGTGKTYLSTSWAKRALKRNERTLVVCYNKFLGFEIQQQLTQFVEDEELATDFLAGSFHAIMNKVLGDKAPQVPDNAPQEWWDTAHAQALIENAPTLDGTFDTIIIDEMQDFFPLWLTALQALQVSQANARFFVSGDNQQAIYAEPWIPTSEYMRIPLTNNLRNSQTIARLVSQSGGVVASSLAPQGPQIEIIRVGGAKERRKAVAAAIKRVHEELQVPLSQILVLAPHRADVADLTSQSVGDYTLATWWDRSEDTVVCGTIQGTKGLERAAVILTCMDEELDSTLFYIGASRAVTSLTIIGRESFLETYGLLSSGVATT
jgi:hypothetical protein